MKKVTLLLLLSITYAFGQIPAGYYNSANGLTGANLKTALKTIITNGHNDQGYSGLWTGYQTTDRDYFFENDGTILDYYSENPNGTDPYQFTVGNDQCGSYSGEGSCYNREHIVPQSLFNSAAPMKNDIHHVRPTDGYVNGRRSHYPFGKVGSASWTSQNGSKVGSSSSTGYSGTVFEPIDQFKGDIARMVFYFVTRYETQLSGFSSGGMLGSSAYPGLQQWELDVLMAWHTQDPVSNFEIARNNASYNFQGNRNPYIDHPEYVNAVWNPSASSDTTPPSSPTNLTASNPTANSIDISWTASTDNIGVVAYEIYVDGVLNTTVSGTITSTTINGLSASTTYQITVKAKDAAGNISSVSNTASETTLSGSTGGGNTGTTCGTEDFENMPSSSSSYSTRTWTNNSITWTSTNSRTDQTLSGRAICVRNGDLSSSSIANGIGSVTVTTERAFSGGSGNLTLKINGNAVGIIPYGSSQNTTTINNINVNGNFTIDIENTTSDRVKIDDVSWTCYSLATDEVHQDNNHFEFYPNPVTNGVIHYHGKDAKTIEWIKIYTISGQLIQKIETPFKNKNTINVSSLPKGTYILQTPLKVSKFIKK